ncbi:uncharacterized protein LOC111118093 isoform X3 [Crassostrea virginica]
MTCSRSLLCSLLCLELVALLMFVSCIILQKYTGATFNTSDVAFITSVLVICLIILCITICFCATSSSGCKIHLSKEEQTVTKEDVSRKLMPIQNDFAEFECPICLTTVQSPLAQLSCKHNYHERCIREWFSTSRDFRCPKCRRVCKDQPKKTLTFTSILNRKLKDDMYVHLPSENV